MWFTREYIYLELLLVSVLVYIYIKHTQSYQVGVSITCFHGNLVWLININPTEEICVLLYNTYLCYIYNRDRYVQSKSIIKYFITFCGNVNLILPQVMRSLSTSFIPKGLQKMLIVIVLIDSIDLDQAHMYLGTTLVLKGFCCIIIR